MVMLVFPYYQYMYKSFKCAMSFVHNGLICGSRSEVEERHFIKVRCTVTSRHFERALRRSNHQK